MNLSDLLSLALNKAGKSETLATVLDLSPSALSKRINGEVGWQEKEINKLLEYTEHTISSRMDTFQKINTLKEAIKILIFEDNGDR